jgi:hypothetical protein
VGLCPELDGQTRPPLLAAGERPFHQAPAHLLSPCLTTHDHAADSGSGAVDGGRQDPGVRRDRVVATDQVPGAPEEVEPVGILAGTLLLDG